MSVSIVKSNLSKKKMSENSREFKRSLTLLDATMLIAGSMIGSGIFIVSAEMSRQVGSSGWLIFLWLLTGVITIFGALSYGELAGMMPEAGGQFVYIERAFGKLTAFLYGWSVFTVIQSGVIAAVAVAFAKYSAVFFPSLSPENIVFQLGFLKVSASQLTAIGVLVVLTYVNSRGIQNGKMIQLVFTGTKLFALFGLIVLGLVVGSKTGYFSQNMTGLWDASQMTKSTDGSWHLESLTGFALVLALGTALIGSLFSSDSWNNVTFIAGEIKDPKRNIPRSLVLGTCIVTFLYIMANFAYLALLPLKGIPGGMDAASQGIMFAKYDRVGAAAASMIFGDVSLKIMALLIMVSTFGCVNGLILSGARVYYAMAKEGMFFRKAGVLNRAQVPGFALWIQCLWTGMLCLSGSYNELLEYCTFTSLLFYAVTIAGVFMLRKKDPGADRPYRVPLYPIVPLVYIVLAACISGILLYTKTKSVGYGLIIVLLGIPIYYRYIFGKKDA